MFAALANGLATKKSNGKFASRFVRKMFDRRSVSKSAPTWLCETFVTKPLFVKLALDAEPNKAVKIGSVTCPGKPLLPKLQAGCPALPQFGFAAMKRFKLFFAFLNSVR